jgi:hypothetical protein
MMAMAMTFVVEVQCRVWDVFGPGRCLGSLLAEEVVVSIDLEQQADVEQNRVKFGIISTDGLLPVDGTTIEGTVLSFLQVPVRLQVDVEDLRQGMLSASTFFQRGLDRNPLSAYATLQAEISAWLSRCSMFGEAGIEPRDWKMLLQFVSAERTGLASRCIDRFPFPDWASDSRSE